MCYILTSIYHNRVQNQRPERKMNTSEIKHVLLQHQDRVLVGRKEYQRVNVRRSSLLKDAFRKFSRHSFIVEKLLRIIFVGEQAVDEGGPRCEFLHLMHDIFIKSGLFAGYPDYVVPLHNVEAVENNKLYTVGKMIAVSVG